MSRQGCLDRLLPLLGTSPGRGDKRMGAGGRGGPGAGEAWRPIPGCRRQAERGVGLRRQHGVPAAGQRPHPGAALRRGECAAALPSRVTRVPPTSPPGAEPHSLSPPSCGCQVLSELVTTHHLKLTNATEIPHYFRLLVSKPFSVSQVGASRPRAPGWKQEGEEETAARGRQLVLHPQENMLVSGTHSWAGGHPALTSLHVYAQTARPRSTLPGLHSDPDFGSIQARHALHTQGPAPKTDR